MKESLNNEISSSEESPFFESIIIDRKVINGILDFTKEVVGYFRNLNLKPQIHVPFVANMNSFKEKLKKAPVKSVGIIVGVFNEQTDDFEDVCQVEADGLDQKTREVLGREELVVLS